MRKSLFTTLAALLLATLSGATFAQQVYKCKDAGGKTVYSQTPCASLSDPSQTRMSTQTGAGSFAGSSSTKEEKVSRTAKKADDDKRAAAKETEAKEAKEAQQAETAKDLEKRTNRCNLLKREATAHEAKLRGGAATAEFESAKRAKDANWAEQTKERCGELK